MSKTEDTQSGEDLAAEIEALRKRQRDQEQTIERLEEENEALEDRLEDVADSAIPKPSRRQVLKAGGVAGAGLLFGSATSGSASGATGAIGSSSQRYDFFGGTVDANVVNADFASVTNLISVGYSTSTQTISTSSVTKVQLDSVEAEDPSVVDLDTANNNITVQNAGVYAVSAAVQWDSDTGFSSGDTSGCLIFKNGSVAVSGNQKKVGTGVQRVRNTYITRLAATDTIDMRAFQTSGADQVLRSGQNVTRLEVVRLG